MRGATVEIVWHLWRLTRAEALYITGTVVGCWAMMDLLLPGALPFVMPVLFPLLAFLSVVTCLWTAGLDNPKAPVAFPLRRHFTQPVHTFTLVGITMAYTALKSAVVFLVSGGFAQVLLGMDLPLASTAAVVAAASVAIEAAVWAPRSTAGRAFAYLLAVFAMLSVVVWWLEIGGTAFDEGEVNRLTDGSLVLTAKGYGVLLLVGLGALALGTASVSRQRQGEGLLPDLRGLARVRAAKKLRPARAFGGPMRAQAWYEMRRVLAAAVPVGLGFLIIAVLLSTAVETMAPGEKSAVFTVWVLQLGAAMLLGAVLALDRSVSLLYHGGSGRLSAFDATLPIGNGRMAFIKTVSTAAGGAVAGLVVVAGIAVWTALHASSVDWTALAHRLGDYSAGLMSEFRSARPEVQSFMVLGCVGYALIALMSLAGGPGMVMAGTLAVTRWMKGAGALGAWFIGNGLLGAIGAGMGWNLRPFQRAQGWAFVAIVILGTAWISYRAVRRGYVGKWVFAAALAVWAGTAGLWVYILSYTPLNAAMLEKKLLIFGMFAAAYCLLLAAFTLPSTVYAAYRHR